MESMKDCSSLEPLVGRVCLLAGKSDEPSVIRDLAIRTLPSMALSFPLQGNQILETLNHIQKSATEELQSCVYESLDLIQKCKEASSPLVTKSPQRVKFFVKSSTSENDNLLISQSQNCMRIRQKSNPVKRRSMQSWGSLPKIITQTSIPKQKNITGSCVMLPKLA